MKDFLKKGKMAISVSEQIRIRFMLGFESDSEGFGGLFVSDDAVSWSLVIRITSNSRAWYYIEVFGRFE